MENNVLIITGMHRSGTSLITQWLHACGLHVGARLVGPAIGNEDGHFEDLDFFNFHRSSLHTQQLPDSGFIHHTVKNLPVRQLLQLRTLLQHKNNAQLQWGWKDPRTCLFLDLYRRLLPQARYLVIWRRYQRVVSSLITRLYEEDVAAHKQQKNISNWWWNLTKRKQHKTTLCEKYGEHFLKIWINYNEAILQHLRQLPHAAYLVVEQAALPTKDQWVFEHLATEWQFKLQYRHFESVYKERMISKVLDIDACITDKELLAHAAHVQQQLATAGISAG